MEYPLNLVDVSGVLILLAGQPILPNPLTGKTFWTVPNQGGLKSGGEGEIRTPGGVTHTRFPIVLLRPARTPLLKLFLRWERNYLHQFAFECKPCARFRKGSPGRALLPGSGHARTLPLTTGVRVSGLLAACLLFPAISDAPHRECRGTDGQRACPWSLF